MRIVRATPDQAAVLTKIAFATKRHWGYPACLMKRWTSVLTITSRYVVDHPVYVATRGRRIVGFCALRFEKKDAWLDHLWVLPAAIRSGVGRALFRHAEEIARKTGAKRIMVESDPHAEGFYLRMGAMDVGRRPAAIDQEKERFLPLLEKNTPVSWPCRQPDRVAPSGAPSSARCSAPGSIHCQTGRMPTATMVAM